MSILTQAEARTYAAQAGFSGSGLDIIVAIAQAESSLNTDARHSNGDGSVDRGILQINSRWHAEVVDSCAYSPSCAFSAGYRISSNGTNFNQWASYSSGAYRRYLTGTGTGTGEVATSGGSMPWYKYPVTHGYITTYEGPGTDTPHYAEDFATPFHTQFFFPKSGTITIADYKAWGGQEYLQPDDGSTREYVAHLDDIYVSPGQHVQAGQVTGLTGGQTSGGDHPTSPQYSTGAHTHFGYSTGLTQTPDGRTIDYGPDPSALVQELEVGNLGAIETGVTPLSSSLPEGSGSGDTVQQHQSISATVHDVLVEVPGFAGLALALDLAGQFPGLIWYQAGKSYQIVQGGWAGDVINSLGSDLINIGSADYIGAAMRSIMDTIMSNMLVFLFRATIVGVGLFLAAALLWKFVNDSGILQDAMQVAKVAV